MDVLQVEAFEEVIVNFGGSGAITNLMLTHVPEPGTALLVGMGIAGMAISRARRHHS
jgi:hypothetical protein